MDTFDDKSVLVTGGTGSFGRAFIERALSESRVRRLIVFSRDELKQYEMQQLYPDEPRLRFFIGDVRDLGRLRRAFHGVDIVIHAAAMKHIPAAEYNPVEAVRTNIHGAENVVSAAIDEGVGQVVALSTDKASSPINLYGATKLVSDKLFVAGNAYAGADATRFAVVRYGNVVGSRGSVIPFFRKLAESGRIPITDERMTRFWITLPQAVDFVLLALERMQGAEIFVPKLPSMRVVDLAHAVAPGAELDFVGIRPGEKLHEEMISENDARRSFDAGSHYVVEPETNSWKRQAPAGEALPEGFAYCSDSNTQWLSVADLEKMIEGL